MATRKMTKGQTMIYKTLQKANDWATQTPLQTTGSVSNPCSTSGIGDKS